MKRAPAFPELALYRAPHLRHDLVETEQSTASTRSTRLTLGTTLIVTAMCLGVAALFILSTVRTTEVNANRADVPVDSPSVSQWRVSAFKPSQNLQRGDTVVVHREGESAVQQVAAGANEAVLLKRGSTVQGLFMAGPKRYVVISDRETKIVDAKEIIATVTPAGERQR